MVPLIVGALVATALVPVASAQAATGVSALIKAMTLDEKISFVHGGTDPQALGEAGYVPGVARLGVPPLRLTDGPAGVRVSKPSTAMPAPVALASSFDAPLAQKYGEVIGRDGRALQQDVLLSPMVNTIRVPYGGRNFETFSEDPLVSATTVANEVKGIQSQGLIATTKHYAENNQEQDRMGVDVRVGEQALHEIELRGFEAAVKAGTGSVMCSYNKVNGEYACQNKTLLTSILRSQLGFQGWVMSDWTATQSTAAITTGLDQEMPAGTYLGAPLKAAITSGKIPVSALDTAVSRILTVMGRFDLLQCASASGPVSGCSLPARPAFDQQSDDAVAEQVATDGAVLLKNTGALPLGDESLAVVGTPAADPVIGGGGSSHVTPTHVTAPLDEIKARAGEVSYSAGVEPDGVVIPASALSGGPIDLTGTKALPSGQSYSATRTLKVPATGDYLLSLLITGGIGTLTVDGKQVATGFGLGSDLTGMRANLHLTGGSHTVKLAVNGLAGLSPNTQIRLTWVTPQAFQAGVNAAAATARKAKTAIVFAYDEGTEGADRPSLALPFGQDRLIAAVAKANPNTVVVLNTGSSVTMPWIQSVRSVLDMYYPGQMGGVATAKLLFGEANPSGKLTQTFPVSEQATPFSGNPSRYPGVNKTEQYSEGIYVGYRWYDAQKRSTLFPFGFGLSYTTFRYSGLRAHDDGSGLTVSFTLTNTGSRAGSEVAQVYLGPSPNVKNAQQATNALAGYQKVQLRPGESQRITIRVAERQLQYWNAATHRWTLGTGPRVVRAGSSSRSLPLHTTVSIH
jgi:beta-glucosidase